MPMGWLFGKRQLYDSARTWEWHCLFIASSVEPVGELRLWKLAKHVIQGEFCDSERPKPVGFSHGHFDLVVQALYDATENCFFARK
jgi:hypothetical protein